MYFKKTGYESHNRTTTKKKVTFLDNKCHRFVICKEWHIFLLYVCNEYVRMVNKH
jgi:hypothetical protein